MTGKKFALLLKLKRHLITYNKKKRKCEWKNTMDNDRSLITTY